MIKWPDNYYWKHNQTTNENELYYVEEGQEYFFGSFNGVLSPSEYLALKVVNFRKYVDKLNEERILFGALGSLALINTGEI